MTAQPSDREVLRAVLHEHAAERAGEHPDPDTLAAYLTDELEVEAEALINDHLVACRACASALLDLEPLTRVDAGMPEGVADLAAEAAWRDLRHRVFTEETRARPAVGRPWSTAVAASLLVTTLGMSVWVARLSGTVAELSRPVVNPPTVYFLEGTRSGDEETITVPAEASRYLLTFIPSALETYTEYEARFSDPQGRELLHVPGLKKLSEGEGLKVLLPRDRLPPGDYLVVLNGFDGERWRKVGEYRRRIVQAASGPG